MTFKRKHLPEGVSAFLEAAQVLPAHGKLLKSGARGQGVVSHHETIALTQFGDETWYSVHRLGVHARNREAAAICWCSRDGGHAVTAIGQWQGR
jgi:hypothetical protein